MREDATAALQRLIAGHLAAVIFEGGPFYVQFADDGSGQLLCEAAGDANLPERLTPDQLRRLVDFGFEPPSRDGAGNHVRKLPSEAEAAATFALEVLSSVYGVPAESVSVNEV